jgi:hypothetical protein
MTADEVRREARRLMNLYGRKALLIDGMAAARHGLEGRISDAANWRRIVIAIRSQMN